MHAGWVADGVPVVRVGATEESGTRGAAHRRVDEEISQLGPALSEKSPGEQSLTINVLDIITSKSSEVLALKLVINIV